MSGYFPRPSTGISVYGFIPSTNGNGGSYTLFASGMTGTTPVLTPYAAAPLYAFTTFNALLPSTVWSSGGVGGILFQANDDAGFTATPLRGIDHDGSEHVFWPDIRFTSGLW